MIALITPTGARPKQIALCAKFMCRQDYTGKVLWVLVDDAEPVSVNQIPLAFRGHWEIRKLYPIPKWKVGMNTQARNLLAGIEYVKQRDDVEAIFIIEDDDYYGPQYLSTMVKKLEGYEIAGQQYTVYYNPVYRG